MHNNRVSICTARDMNLLRNVIIIITTALYNFYNNYPSAIVINELYLSEI